MTSLYSVSVGEQTEFWRIMSEHMSADELKQALKRTELIRTMLEAFRADERSCLIYNMFRPASDHLEIWRKWNKKFDLGITKEEFQSVGEPPSFKVPAKNGVGNRNLVAVQLVWYSGDNIGDFLKMWKIIRSQHKNKENDDSSKITRDNLRLRDGVKYINKRGFRWEKIHLGCYFGGQSKDLLTEVEKSTNGAAKVAHLGVLAAVALHPYWIRAMNGESVPFLYFAGFEIWDGEYSLVPWIIYKKNGDLLNFYIGGGWVLGSYKFASPCFSTILD